MTLFSDPHTNHKWVHSLNLITHHVNSERFVSNETNEFKSRRKTSTFLLYIQPVALPLHYKTKLQIFIMFVKYQIKTFDLELRYYNSIELRTKARKRRRKKKICNKLEWHVFFVDISYPTVRYK